MIRPKSETEYLSLSILKNCEIPINQNQTRPQDTLEFKVSKQRETFSFKPPISIEGSSMVGLPGLELYFFIFNITEKNNKFELYTDAFDEFSFEELKHELEKILSISDITSSHQQHEKRPRIIQAYKKLRLEKSSIGGYVILIMANDRAPFRDLESYFSIVVGLDEEDIQLFIKQHNSNFVKHELSPGIYTIKDSSEAVYTMGGHKGTVKIEYDDISPKTKLFLTRFE